MLGESLEDIGNLMLSDEITDLVNGYSSSVFDKNKNTDKIKYIKDKIRETEDPVTLEKYSKLLEKTIAAEEVRILGKMLKINQGLPTNTAETYSYIKSIEKYIESRYNKDNLETLEQALSAYLAEADIDKESPKAKKLGKQYSELKAKMFEEWINFDLIQFIIDPIYKQEQINKYNGVKVNFNILEVISEVPHFKEMFNVLSVNKQVLNNLSTRNRLEDIVLNQVIHRGKNERGQRDNKKVNKQKTLDKEEIRELRDLVDIHLINSWIMSKDFSINIPANATNNPAPKVLELNTISNIDTFRDYVEKYAIPLLKQKLPGNKFISLLTFGLKQATPFYKLPFNMSQVDNTQKTRTAYEDALYAFNNLKTIKVDGIDMNLVDMFYLYNLIVNRDKFGPNSLTRIFEDLIAAEGNEDLLVYDFNAWLDKQDIEKLVSTFPMQGILMKESTPVIEDIIKHNDADSDTSEIGFKVQPTEADLEEAALEERPTSVTNSQLDSTSNYYDTQPSVESKLIALVKSANMKGLHLVSDSDLVNMDSSIRNAKGFILNGEIYINTDRATDDTIIHEFGHLYLADAKLRNPNEYYQLLAKVRETDLWKEMRGLSEYNNKRGSDFDEEVLASMISDYKKLGTTNYNDIVVQALDLVSQEYKEFLESDILPTLSDVFIDMYKYNQKLATIKNQLIKDSIIKEDCK